MSRVLIAEDEPGSATAVKLYLERVGHEVRAWELPVRNLDVISEFKPDVVLCDWLLGEGADGLEVAEQLREHAPEVRFILMTGMPSLELEDRLCRMDACQVLYKPFHLSELEAVVGLCGTDEKGAARTRTAPGR